MAFGLGITIIYNLTEEMDTMATKVDEQTQRQLEQSLAKGGTQIAMPFNRKELPRGEKNELAFGIKNTESEEEDFTIKINCVSAYEHQREGGDPICADTDSCVDYCGNEAEEDKVAVLLGEKMNNAGTGWEKEIEHRERHMENMMIIVGSETESGRYTFTLEVEKGTGGTSDTYGTPKRFYVNVY